MTENDHLGFAGSSLKKDVGALKFGSTGQVIEFHQGHHWDTFATHLGSECVEFGSPLES